MPIENVKCPECDGPMISRKSSYGTFWGCKDYPRCKGTRDSMGRSKAERDAENKQNEKQDSESSYDRQNDNDRYRFRKQ